MWHVFGANSESQQMLFQSGWFVVGLLTQTLIVHLIRTPKLPLAYFPWLAVILLGYAVLTTAMKRYYIRRYGWQ